jgi:hypothetical protein
MPVHVPAPRIRLSQSPRIVIADCFGKDSDLPIRGGWGYDVDDAVVIDKGAPSVAPDAPFNGVAVEYAYVEKRIYLELIVLRPEDDRFSGIEWKLLEQRLIERDARPYDILQFEVLALRTEDWNELKAAWESPHGHGSPDFDESAHNERHAALTIRYVTEFWFEISSFFGQG